ncbi:hypothetical protein RQP46_000504 [Phenoliferia psychrophenolica]
MLLIDIGLRYWHAMRTKGEQPGYVAVFAPFTFLALVFVPHHWRFNLQQPTAWNLKRTLFERFDSTVLVIPALFGRPLTYLVGDAAAVKIINSDNAHFTKGSFTNFKAALFYGENVFTADGAEWRRHRKVMASSFSRVIDEKVWKSTLETALSIFERIESVADDNGVAVVFTSAAFGLQMPWPSDDARNELDSSRPMELFNAIRVVLEEYIAIAVVPDWGFKLPIKKLRYIDHGFKEFVRELKEVIEIRRTKGTPEGEEDLLGALVAANAAESGKAQLTDQEIDAYVTLGGGHETTASSIAATFFLLALNPSEQDILHEEAVEVLGSDCTALAQLKRTAAAFQEATWLLGPNVVTAKAAIKDTVLPAHTVPTDGSKPVLTQIRVPAGAVMQTHLAAIHHNPAYWPEPEVFRPSRFLEETFDPSDGTFVAFSSGLRRCPGLTFAMTEGVGFIAAVMQKYVIEVPEGRKDEFKLRPNETAHQRYARLYKPDFVINVHPNDLHLAFRRRA